MEKSRQPTIIEELRNGAKYMYGLASEVGRVTGIVDIEDDKIGSVDAYNTKERLAAVAIVSTLVMTYWSLDKKPPTNKSMDKN